jgi:Protein of unknown function (DUF2612)
MSAHSLPISYYLSLLTSQYQQSTNFLGWLSIPLRRLDDASVCLDGFDAAFNLDQAVATELDTLGRIVGQPRTVGFQPSNGVSPVLDDDTYRLLLRARIAQNQWDGRIDSLQAIWQTLFPGGRINIIDGQNMTVSIILSGVFTSITQDLITNGYIVPRPQGVLYNYSFSTLPIFGFDQDSAFIAGFDKGKWS